MFRNLLVSLSLILCFSLSAGEVAGIKLPETYEIDGKKLYLNGAGVRRGTFLNIRVYVGALYLLKKSKDVEAILNMPNPKHISMTFIRDANREALQEAWKEGFFAAVPKGKRKPLLGFLNKLNENMEDIKKKQVILLNFLDKGVKVTFNRKSIPIIGNKEFSRALLSIWFIKARDKELRDKMLGID